MKNTAIIAVGSAALLLGVTGALAYGDRDERKVTICHATESSSNPWVRIVTDEHGIGGHFYNNGTPKAGHEDDILLEGRQECPAVSPSPTPTATPATPTPTPETPTPSPSASPSPSESPTATPEPSNTPEVTTTPSPSATATPEPSSTPPGCEGDCQETPKPSKTPRPHRGGGGSGGGCPAPEVIGWASTCWCASAGHGDPRCGSEPVPSPSPIWTPGPIQQASQISTGPADSILLSLAIAAIITALSGAWMLRPAAQRT